jgi:hypothetical protein
MYPPFPDTVSVPLSACHPAFGWAAVAPRLSGAQPNGKTAQSVFSFRFLVIVYQRLISFSQWLSPICFQPPATNIVSHKLSPNIFHYSLLFDLLRVPQAPTKKPLNKCWEGLLKDLSSLIGRCVNYPACCRILSLCR